MKSRLAVRIGERFRLARHISWISAVVYLAVAAVVQAQFDYQYTIGNGSVTINRYIGPGGEVIIPDSIADLPVTRIENAAFSWFPNRENLTSVVVPDSVTSIGLSAFQFCSHLTNAVIGNRVSSIDASAFGGCTNLSNLVLGNGLTSIGVWCFSNCVSLTSVSIPDAVTNIGQLAFVGCSNLTNVNIPRNVASLGEPLDFMAFRDCFNLSAINVDPFNVTFSSLDGVLYDKYRTFLILCPPRKEGSFVVPESVGSIGISAFFRCEGLTSISVGNSVTNIADYAFHFCSGLTNLTLGTNVTFIGAYGLGSCSNLTTVRIPDSVMRVRGYAFDSCVSLTNVILSSHLTLVEGSTFSHCISLASITIPDSVTYIGPSAFWGCSNLASAAIGQSVTNIDDFAFVSCHNLKSVTLPDSVIRVGVAAFSRLGGLTNVTIGRNAAYLGPEGNVFSFCSNLVAITVDPLNSSFCSLDGVQYDKAQTRLIQCPARKEGSLVVPDSVTDLQAYALSYCSLLTNVVLGSGVASLGYAIDPFGDCSSLVAIEVNPQNTNYSSSEGVLFHQDPPRLVRCPRGKSGRYTIPENVTIIGGGAFFNCTGLAGVLIPNGVRAIGVSAFENCTGLASLTIPATVEWIFEKSFASCSQLTGVYFLGNAPAVFGSGNPFPGPFLNDPLVTVFYLPGTTGWGPSYGGAPTMLWNPNQQSPGFVAGQFGFGITGPRDAGIIVEACADLSSPNWLPVSTNVLDASGTSSFSDPQSSSQSVRFYRFRSP